MTPQPIGHYRVTALLGKGGMGEVYRARDTKLDRDVAIKVLPPAFASDADRMARFEREAKVLASLNHPNIAAIYGVEDRALVMELVEGESPKGPLPFEDAWKIALQLADALEYAHEKGVVHRDLKPANVKVTPDGVVKLLDFGLAKAFSDTPESPSSDAVNSPTLTMNATVAGVILGTAAYMAPEQAKGKKVDKRADIWSWGVVLYELLTGDRLFKGDDAADTLAQVLTKEPDLDRVPPNVRKLLRRCLEKDPKQRLRDIGEARYLLDEPAAPAPSRSRLGITAIAAVTTLVAAGLGFGWWRATRPVEHALVRLDVDLGSDVSLVPPTDSGSSVILSPDGTRLVYLNNIGNGQARLLTRQLDQLNGTALPGTEGARDAFFSPDGQWIGFVTGRRLNKISVQGGAVVALADLPTFFGATWGEDGSIVVGGIATQGLLRIPAGGGPATPLEGLGSDDFGLILPRILPGGKALLFTGWRSGATANIEVLTMTDHRRKTLAQGQSPHYLPVSDHEGYLVYNNRATLFAVPLDLDKLETRGTAVPILNDVAYHPFSGTGQFALSASGTLVYRRGGAGGEPAMSTIEWLDPAGKRQPLLAKPGPYSYLSLSPDGRRLAMRVSNASSPGIWTYDLQRDITARLGASGGTHPIWSPDGKYVVLGSIDGMSWTRSDGAGQPQRLSQGIQQQVPYSFTPDGGWLACQGTGIWTVPIQEDATGLKAGTPEQFLKDSSATAPEFSPDGHWLAYSSNASGNYEFYVRPFPPPASGQGAQWQISNGGAGRNLFGLAWSRTGHELYYQSGDEIMAVSYTVQGDTFVPDKPRVWIPKVGGTQWDLAPDGKRIAVVTPVKSGEAPKADHEVVFLLNFLDYLKQQVPLNK